MAVRPGLFTDFRLLLILFIAFRLMLLIAYEPILLPTGERGLTTGGDFLTYHQLASLSEDGAYPYQQWWSEFPPLWGHLQIVIYQLSRGSYTLFALILGSLLLMADVGILNLIRLIGGRLHGEGTGMALAWIYTLLSAPLVFSWWSFEHFAAFFLLQGLWWLLQGRDSISAITAGLGALTKFTPALLLGAAIRYRSRPAAARYLAITIGIFVGVYALLYLTSPNSGMVTASLVAQFGKASYQSVWALIDGNYSTGNFAAPGVDPIAIRFDPAAATTIYGNPAVIPGPIRLIGAALIGLWILMRTRRYDDKGIVAFVLITLLIFFLQAQGWSPQWLVQIIPLILLLFPQRTGVLIVLVLSGLAFVEYPLLFIRTGDTATPGVISGDLLMPYVLMILLRTTILIGVCVALYQVLRREIQHE